MATDIFLKFEGGAEITGESQVEGYADGWLESNSFSEGASIPRDPSGSGQATGRATVQDFTITTEAGTHSNQLRQAILKNEVFPKLTVHFVKQIKEKNEGYDIRIYKNAFVSFYSGSKGNDGKMYESWTIGAQSVEWEYKKQNPDTHDLVTANQLNWDMSKSTAA